MKCRRKGSILSRTFTPRAQDIGRCGHKFCQRCFRKENTNLAYSKSYTYHCPCCHAQFYDNMQSIDEGILIGEAVTLYNQVSPYYLLPTNVAISTEQISDINQVNDTIIAKLEAALEMNPLNMYTLYSLYAISHKCENFNIKLKQSISTVEFYRFKVFDCAFKLFDYPTVPEAYEFARYECCFDLARTFHMYHNYPTALKYNKLAYEYCLRSSDHTRLPRYKADLLDLHAALAKLPPLRFAVGDEVEFLHELETGSEWKLGKVVELHYRERGFKITFTAPYRLQLLDGSVDQPPVYAWVKADIDRYVRKVGVRSIEDTRYQARLDAKIAELVHVYCSDEFIESIYHTLAKDQEFVDMVQSVWRVELSEDMLYKYRFYVMLRLPLVRLDTGYHVPSTEEVIAGIRAYFDPGLLSGDAASSTAADENLQRVRADVFKVLRDERISLAGFDGDFNFQGYLLHSITYFMLALASPDASGSAAIVPADSNFTVPLEMSEALSNVSTTYDIHGILSRFNYNIRFRHFLNAWIDAHLCLDNTASGPACECPFVYFFVRTCLDLQTGVPKLALALYDRMNMQLSREFIRCANPSCQLNKLDKSTGQVKFKQCTRCKAVIYCSRECQVAHYPEHKTPCREYSTG